jgi:hypothetical protein
MLLFLSRGFISVADNNNKRRRLFLMSSGTPPHIYVCFRRFFFCLSVVRWREKKKGKQKNKATLEASAPNFRWSPLRLFVCVCVQKGADQLSSLGEGNHSNNKQTRKTSSHTPPFHLHNDDDGITTTNSLSRIEKHNDDERRKHSLRGGGPGEQEYEEGTPVKAMKQRGGGEVIKGVRQRKENAFLQKRHRTKLTRNHKLNNQPTHRYTARERGGEALDATEADRLLTRKETK